MKKYSTIIIDDEQIARERLKRLLKNFNDVFDVIGEAKNGEEGLALIRKLQPDLVFLDIQMPGLSGFEMLRKLEEFPIVIFCTAYEEFALQAFNTNAVDYLVKPVETERLSLTVDKIKQVRPENSKPDMNEILKLIQLQNEPKKMHSIPHKIGDRVILVKLENITYLVANEKYVEFFTLDGKKYVTELSLKKLEERLPENYIRIQRAIIVNTDHIKEFRKYFRGKFILIMNDLHSTKVESGRSYTNVIRNLID